MGNPLFKKLGIKNGLTLLVLNSPQFYWDFFHDFPENVVINEFPDENKVSFIHFFATSQAELNDLFDLALDQLSEKGMIWVSWPKKSANVSTSIDKFTVIKAGRSRNMVDVKVASINDIWSGQKFTFRKK